MATRAHFPERKAKRKAEAEERQKRFDALPIEEKVRRKGAWSEKLLAEIGEEVKR